MKSLVVGIIAVLGLVAVAPVQAQVVPRTGTVNGMWSSYPANPHQTVIAGQPMTLDADRNPFDAHNMNALKEVSGGGACQVGQILGPGESCTVGFITFQVLSDGRGSYGGITADGSITSGDFEASRISGTNNWRIDAVPGSGGSEFVDIQYDQGDAVGASNDGNHLFISLPDEARMSTRFAPKASSGDGREVRIDRIWLAPYFNSQFGNTILPSSAPRDLTVYIYTDHGGQPGTVLFSKVVEDPRTFAPVTDFTLNFFELDLSNEGIGVLPDTVHIVYGNAGSDDNTLSIGPAPYTTENVSYLYPVNSAWAPLWNVTTTTGDSFDETVVPIRARFSLGSTTASLSFAQGVVDQLFLQGQSITPLELPEATGGVSPISYSLAPAPPAGLSFDRSTRTISGTPTEVTSAPVQITYRATDAAGGEASLQFNIEVYASTDGSELVNIQYDHGEAVGASNGGNHLFFRLPDEARMSTRFAPEASSGGGREVRIDRIWLAPYFDNQFGNTTLPSSAPRDLTVYIYSDQGGQPGTVLFSKVVEDPRTFAPVSDFTLNFIELDLSNEGIGVLPDVVHIAYGNAGGDDNTLSIGPAPYTTKNVSHIYPVDSVWAPLWSVTVTTTAGSSSFYSTVVPIRARFSLGGTTAPLSFAQGIVDQSFPRGRSITPLILPAATGGVLPISYSLASAPPTGLSFDPSTRTISGTPAEVTSAPVQVTYRATDAAGDAASLQFNIEVYSPVHIEQEILPEVFAVHGNYPNPFRQSTRLVFDLPISGRVTVEVVDVVGRRVLTVPPVDVAAGWENHLELDGQSLPPGHYLYRVVVSSAEGSSSQTGHFVRVR